MFRCSERHAAKFGNNITVNFNGPASVKGVSGTPPISVTERGTIHTGSKITFSAQRLGPKPLRVELPNRADFGRDRHSKKQRISSVGKLFIERARSVACTALNPSRAGGAYRPFARPAFQRRLKFPDRRAARTPDCVER
jgi:hypothetical protein